MLTNQTARRLLLAARGFTPVVYLDDGHGYDPTTGEATPGKRTPPFPVDTEAGKKGTVIHENEFNRAVVAFTGNILVSHGLRVVEVAVELTDTPLSTRVDRANRDYHSQGRPLMNAAYVSVHFNALNGVFDNKSGGVETFSFPGSTQGKLLAEAIHSEVIKGTRQVDRGLKEDKFYVLKYSLMPAALVECGFMDKMTEAVLMRSKVFQLETATQIATGVLKYFGVSVSPVVMKAYSAVRHAKNMLTITDEQVWMDVLMGYEPPNLDWMADMMLKI